MFRDGAVLQQNMPVPVLGQAAANARLKAEIAGKDRIFYPASFVAIERDSLCLSSDKVSLPCTVRYGWSDAAVSTLYNSSNLPASPFRTDDWDF